jgi:hypothetical protein
VRLIRLGDPYATCWLYTAQGGDASYFHLFLPVYLFLGGFTHPVFGEEVIGPRLRLVGHSESVSMNVATTQFRKHN